MLNKSKIKDKIKEWLQLEAKKTLIIGIQYIVRLILLKYFLGYKILNNSLRSLKTSAFGDRPYSAEPGTLVAMRYDGVESDVNLLYSQGSQMKPILGAELTVKRDASI